MENKIKLREIPEETRKNIDKYLSSRFCLFEIVKSVGHREMGFKLFTDNKKDDKLPRYFVAYNIDFLERHIARLELKTICRNFYCSCASLSFIPILTYNFTIRSKTLEYQDFHKNYENYVNLFDFFIDIDGKKDFKKCLEETKTIMEIFQSYKLPFFIHNSSGKGFHIILSGEYLKIAFPEKPINELLKEIQSIYKNLIKIYDFKCLDKEVIMDIKQFRKPSYSVTIDNFCCLPLSNQQFLDCEKSMDFLKIENVLKNIRIKERGLLTRNINIPDSEIAKNIQKFWKEFVE